MGNSSWCTGLFLRFLGAPPPALTEPTMASAGVSARGQSNQAGPVVTCTIFIAIPMQFARARRALDTAWHPTLDSAKLDLHRFTLFFGESVGGRVSEKGRPSPFQ